MPAVVIVQNHLVVVAAQAVLDQVPDQERQFLGLPLGLGILVEIAALCSETYAERALSSAATSARMSGLGVKVMSISLPDFLILCSAAFAGR